MIEEVREGVRVPGLVFLFVVVPAVILGVEAVIRSEFWFLSEFSRGYFRFPLTVDTFWNVRVLWKAFISSLAHNSLHPHLSGNLFIYLVAMALMYPLAILANRKRMFWFTTAFSLLLVPFFTSYASLQNPIGHTSIGFSSVVAAFLGALPIFLVLSVREQSEIEFISLFSTGPMFLILAGIAFIGGSSLIIILFSIVMATVIGVVTVIYMGFEDLIEFSHVMTWPSNVFHWWGLATAIAGPYLLFFQISPETNVVSHLAGYLAGYLFALLLVGDAENFDLSHVSIKGM